MNPQRMKRLGVVLGVVLFSQIAVSCLQEAALPPPSATADVTVVTAAEPVASYVVQRGDRLVDIAAEQDVSLGLLIELNGITDPDVIEVGDVILLEAQPEEPAASTVAEPVATRAPLPRIVATEPVEESFNDRLSEWWAGIPKPSLTGDAIQQGLFAAVALPSLVVGFILLVMMARLAIRLLRTASRIAFGRSAASVDQEETPSEDSTHAEAQRRRRIPGLAFVGGGGRWVATVFGRLGTSIRGVGFGWLTRPLAAASRIALRAGRWVAAVALAAARYVGRMLHLNARKAVGVHTARRERARDHEFQREARGWWSQGRERVRIGLLDEAEECFETGLRLAVEGGWQDEIALYRSELRLLEERRSVERSLVPSIHEV